MNSSYYLNLYIRHLEIEKQYSENTIISYRNDIQQFVQYLENKYSILDISSAGSIHIRSWVVHMMQNKYEPKSVNRKISVLKGLFKFLRKHGVVSSNPASKVISPKLKKRMPNHLKQDDLKKIDTVIDTNEFEGKRDLLIIKLMYQAGLRRSELINLKDDDIDPYRKTISILGKGNKERIVPISGNTLKEIREYIDLRDNWSKDAQEKNVLFITSKGKKLYPKYVYNLCKKYLSQVSTNEKLNPHSLRHSFATHLANNGAELNAIKDLMGHSTLASTEIYLHNSINRLLEVYNSCHPKAK